MRSPQKEISSAYDGKYESNHSLPNPEKMKVLAFANGESQRLLTGIEKSK